MNILADENTDAVVVSRLRADGHAVAYVAEMDPSITDDAVLARAQAGRSIIMTADKDFGEMLFRLGRASHGVILIRLAGLPAATKARLVAEAVRDHGGEMWGAFAVISPGVVRIRRVDSGQSV